MKQLLNKFNNFCCLGMSFDLKMQVETYDQKDT